ncbi:mannose/fructose/sorbose PTS transporter subunit IIB [Clostridium saccharobutylicum]|uniref:ManX: PTS system mannose-specific EIIAB component n=1 Tax=Clostridium saccharobutylicum DSM 13864 TaxID=1345695 RepID=U5N0H7_CLOSA|nr:mannose/fructose/sorbose PTS transporter subunit IIB [Clostridium saccharobutylicum]AGX45406.1 manX: PTS system mannose-specific EIIAB component [Clostridium saccharobutylicum DSM 13864]AQR92681.1 PTS system mannose-specific EIIAB component [Clostridium saccharobutylicum]AQS02583.1 PTS system mannose-specific EIIAB component [Clostridium saccharobutylicum]AQS12189.1 PTS system mannose-specific EIIAB component [Clostridium saccharobutylicum]AQS16566.1 PTS system mannose-specific EIIAB compon
MKIALARIDDRLIHGQVTTIWSKETKCQRIIICNDNVAKDEIRKTLLTQVAPLCIQTHVVSVDKAIRVINNPKYEKDVVLLLFTNPTDVLRLVDAGINIKSVNIGGMCFKEGRTQLTHAVSVNAEDVKAFKSLNDKNIELEIRKIASDSKSYIIPLIEKM